MKPTRSAPVLLLGFGMLIGLIALTGIGALRRARETYRDVSQLNQRYRHTERVLSGIATDIFRVGLLARDYLLDPSNTRAAEYRADLLSAEHRAMDKDLAELWEATRWMPDKPELARLRRRSGRILERARPLFRWTPDEKAARSFDFLRNEVLPRRQAALAMAQEISRLTQANLDDQRRQAIDRKKADVAAYIGRT